MVEGTDVLGPVILVAKASAGPFGETAAAAFVAGAFVVGKFMAWALSGEVFVFGVVSSPGCTTGLTWIGLMWAESGDIISGVVRGPDGESVDEFSATLSAVSEEIPLAPPICALNAASP